jgi:hypothetical protein
MRLQRPRRNVFSAARGDGVGISGAMFSLATQSRHKRRPAEARTVAATLVREELAGVKRVEPEAEPSRPGAHRDADTQRQP